MLLSDRWYLSWLIPWLVGLPVFHVRFYNPLKCLRVTGRTVGGTLRGRPLPSTPPDTDTVDNVALLGFVSETTGLVRAGWARGAVDDVQLAELELMYSQQIFNEYAQDTSRASSSPSIRQQRRSRVVMIMLALCRSRRASWFHGRHTSQQRTRSKKRMTSLCFFF